MGKHSCATCRGNKCLSVSIPEVKLNLKSKLASNQWWVKNCLKVILDLNLPEFNSSPIFKGHGHFLVNFRSRRARVYVGASTWCYFKAQVASFGYIWRTFLIKHWGFRGKEGRKIRSRWKTLWNNQRCQTMSYHSFYNSQIRLHACMLPVICLINKSNHIT